MHDDDKKERNGASEADSVLVDALAEIAVRQDLAEIEFRRDELRIRVTRQHPQAAATISAAAPAAAPAAPAPAAAPSAPVSAPAASATDTGGAHPGAIRSPMVGTVYLRPEPNADKFVEIGGAVKQGDRVMLIEAMKTFNDILAPRDGTLSAVLVNEGEPVEFGEPLFVIE